MAGPQHPESGALTTNGPVSNTHVFEQIKVGSDCVHLAVSTSKKLLNVRDVTIDDRVISVTGDMTDESLQKALLLHAMGKEQAKKEAKEEAERETRAATMQFVYRNGNGQKLGS